MNPPTPEETEAHDALFNALMQDYDRAIYQAIREEKYILTRMTDTARIMKSKDFKRRNLLWFLCKPAPTRKEYYTQRLTAQSATTPSATATATTPSALNIPMLNPSTEQEIIKPTMKTDSSVQSAYFSDIKKDIK